jgi:hypothetical protein
MQIFQVLVIEDQPLFGDMLQRRLKRFFGKQTLILVAGTLERCKASAARQRIQSHRRGCWITRL